MTIVIPKNFLPEIFSSNENFGNIKKEIIGKSLPINAILGDQQSSLYGHKEKENFEKSIRAVKELLNAAKKIDPSL